MRPKEDVRREVWRAMERDGVSRFPGAEGRIPNFAGAKAAAERLARHPAWITAQTLKANPDSPQTHARRLALAQGKVLVMAERRARGPHPLPPPEPQAPGQGELRGGGRLPPAARGPLGPPAAAPDPRDPGARAVRLRGVAP